MQISKGTMPTSILDSLYTSPKLQTCIKGLCVLRTTTSQYIPFPPSSQPPAMFMDSTSSTTTSDEISTAEALPSMFTVTSAKWKCMVNSQYFKKSSCSDGKDLAIETEDCEENCMHTIII